MNDLRYKQVQRTPYSLIELITVMVIMAILMGFGIAAYLGVRGHKGSEAGAQRMADMIALTRQYAISENTRVALLLPMSSDDPDLDKGDYLDSDYEDDLPKTDRIDNANTLNPDTPGITMRLCVISNSNEFVRWIEGTDWVLMPQNSYFFAPGAIHNSVTSVYMPGNNSPTSVPSIIFKSNGTLDAPLAITAGDYHIYIKPYSKKIGDYNPSPANVYGMNIEWLTGAAKTKLLKKVGTKWE